MAQNCPIVDKVKWKTLRCGKTPNNFERFIQSIRTGINDHPDFARGAQVQKWLDLILQNLS